LVKSRFAKFEAAEKSETITIDFEERATSYLKYAAVIALGRITAIGWFIKPDRITISCKTAEKKVNAKIQEATFY
jgi:hypothetical protein